MIYCLIKDRIGCSIYDAVGWVGPARAPPLSFFVRCDLAVGYIVAMIAIEMRVFRCRSYADCLLHNYNSMVRLHLLSMGARLRLICP